MLTSTSVIWISSSGDRGEHRQEPGGVIQATSRYALRAGYISELELSQVKSEYEQALARIPFIQKQIAQQENAISVLLGRNPGPIPRGRTIDELTLPSVPAGLPSDLLERRPDIRQAEQDLIAANARIGAAKALYLSHHLLDRCLRMVEHRPFQALFSGPSQAWSWAGTFIAPIFTGGAVTGQLQGSPGHPAADSSSTTRRPSRQPSGKWMTPWQTRSAPVSS